MNRIYYNLIKHHLQHWDQMVFIEGARQVGKTTLAKQLAAGFKLTHYLNTDNIEDRALILSGQNFVEKLGLLDIASSSKPLIIFDEIHKIPNWKNYLKGFYDSYKDKIKIIATGSAKLSIYKKNQDSLMGRYFSYMLHPISVREIVNASLDENLTVQKPLSVPDAAYNNLLKYGGFPDPYLKADNRFHAGWLNLRFEQLLRGDIVASGETKNIGQFELLAHILTKNAAQQINYNNLSKQVQVTSQTIKSWLNILESFYFGYFIRPWSANITRAILKEPKFYLWDWSAVESTGARAENFIASHLKAAARFWSDAGLGNFGVFYIRTKDKKEVDFLVTKENKPWFLVEVKGSINSSMSKNLHYFQEQTGAAHAFQVVMDMDEHPSVDCFSYNKPIKVSAKTFLSQLA